MRIIQRAARLSVLLLVVATTSFGFSGSARASTWDQVTFEGSGWGHGVGMSQYGAYGMATLGHDYTEILAHYFQGTTIIELDPSNVLWVNLTEKRESFTLTIEDLVEGVGGAAVTLQTGAGSIEVGTGSSIRVSQLSQGCSLEISSVTGEVVTLEDPGCSIQIDWYDWDVIGATPTTKVGLEGCYLADWNVAPTQHRPCEYAFGRLHITAKPTGLYLSAEMLMEDYVKGISEMPYSWKSEALKAQAVAARSYAAGRRILRGEASTNSCFCHVRDTTADQRYVGWGHQKRASWDAAVVSTAHEVLTHPDSYAGVVTTYYSSSSGGATEYGHEKGFASGPVEWLSSVDDSFAVDGTVYNPRANWSYSKSAGWVAAELGLDYLNRVSVTKRRPGSGSAAEVTFRGIKNGVDVEIVKSSSWVRSKMGLLSEYFDVEFRLPGNEILFYKRDGTFDYRDLNPDATVGSSILAGTGYTTGWDVIVPIDLDGDGQDEIFFYREDGLFRFYEIKPDATLGSPILSGDGYTRGWDSIAAVDLDGDGQDEIFFYREDGLFRYYNIRPNGSLPSPSAAGTGYTSGWDSISSVDLDGDGQDEMFFYREDGLFRYYNVRSDGSLPSPIHAGGDYTKNWSSIRAVDLRGDGRDELLFYRRDGLYRFYEVDIFGVLSTPLAQGDDFGMNWDTVAPVELDGR